MQIANDTQRKEVIDYLINSCACWKQQGDRDILNAFSNEKLSVLKETAEQEQKAITVANAAVTGFSEGGNAYRVNPDTGKWERRLLGNADMGGAGKEEEKPKEEEKNKVTEEPAKKPQIQNFNDLLKLAPPYMREQFEATFNNAAQIEQREKDAIIAQLLVNVADADKRIHHERLQKRSLDDLRNDLALVPRMVKEESPQAPVRNATRRQQDDDMLVAPTINWQEVGGQQQETVQNAVGFDEPNEEEWLRNAPASVRAMVMEASAVQNREKRKLIDELTANIADEDAERRLVARLQNKTLEELRDLAALTPRREQPRAHYFGQAAPLANARPNEAFEDILDVPTINWREEVTSNGKHR